MTDTTGRMNAGLFALALLLGVCSTALHAASGTIVGAGAVTVRDGGGPDVFPRLSQNVTGGSSPVTVTFDPSATYAPAGTGYTYQGVWDFGDGSPLFLVPAAPVANLNLALQRVSAVFTRTTDPDQTFTVTFRLNITTPASGGGTAPGPSGVVSTTVRVTDVNFAPVPALTQVSSPAAGTLPYELTVSLSGSQDVDGFLYYGVIQWGDGTSEEVAMPIAVEPPVLLKHIYTLPGIYSVTLTVIDNGRSAVGSTLPTGVVFTDIIGSFNIIRASQAALPENQRSRFTQAFLSVTVPGSVTVEKSDFQLDFAAGKTQADRFQATLRPNLTVENASDANVVVQLGSTVFPAFVTDVRGKFRGLGLTFDINSKRGIIKLRADRRDLKTPFGLGNATVEGGAVQIPVSIIINGTTNYSTIVRYAYESKKDGKGRGRNGQSIPSGN